MKDEDEIIEIEPFELGAKNKKTNDFDESRENIEYDNGDILTFKLYLKFNDIVSFLEGNGDYEPVYKSGEIVSFTKVESGKGSYYTEPRLERKFYLTYLAHCPKCNHLELLVKSLDNIHSTLYDLGFDEGERFKKKGNRPRFLTKFSITAHSDEDEDDWFDIGLKCPRCSNKTFWYLSDTNESEVCDKILDFFSN